MEPSSLLPTSHVMGEETFRHSRFSMTQFLAFPPASPPLMLSFTGSFNTTVSIPCGPTPLHVRPRSPRSRSPFLPFLQQNSHSLFNSSAQPPCGMALTSPNSPLLPLLTKCLSTVCVQIHYHIIPVVCSHSFPQC